jgi:hypothetical protein
MGLKSASRQTIGRPRSQLFGKYFDSARPAAMKPLTSNSSAAQPAMVYRVLVQAPGTSSRSSSVWLISIAPQLLASAMKWFKSKVQTNPAPASLLLKRLPNRGCDVVPYPRNAESRTI